MPLSEDQEKIHDPTKKSHVALIQRLSDLWMDYEPPFESHQWAIESLRWHELLFLILSRMGSKENAESAFVTFSALDLLGVEKLADLDTAPSQRAPSSRYDLMLGVLMEADYDKETAEKTLFTMKEAAKCLQSTCEGKVQKLLRKESFSLVQRMMKTFQFSKLDEKQVELLMIAWLQNILNLPLFLETEGSQAFCDEYQISVEELINAADDLDINLALLDELLGHWYEGKQAIENIVNQEHYIE